MVGCDIDLYEDNAGNLYLHPMLSDWVYQTDPDFSFEEDCQALSENEYVARVHWLSQWVHSYGDIHPLLFHPETHIIATWYNDAPATLRYPPGNAGRTYLELNNDEKGVVS